MRWWDGRGSGCRIRKGEGGGSCCQNRCASCAYWKSCRHGAIRRCSRMRGVASGLAYESVQIPERHRDGPGAKRKKSALRHEEG